MFSLRNEFYSVKTSGGTASGQVSGCASGCGPQTVFQLAPGTVVGSIVPGATISACLAVPCVSPYTLLGVVASFNPTTNTLTSVSPITLTTNSKLFFGSSTGLYKHYSNNVGRGNFYGVGYPSSVSFVVNDNPVKSKSFFTIGYEGSNGWQIDTAGISSDNTGANFSTVSQSWIDVFDQSFDIKSYHEGQFTVVEGTAVSTAAAIGTTSISINNLTGVFGLTQGQVIVPVGATIYGEGVPLGTTIVSYVASTRVLTVSQNLNTAAATLLRFSLTVNRADYNTVFGTSNPGFINNYYQGFNRKENKYVAAIVNDSRVSEGEVNFGNQIAGIKGYYAAVKISTDSLTNPGGEKQLFSVSTDYTANNGY
tara:strand:- start:464 stop:1561 length:1098 start_codon:yes stop_codon:yes gene_type:complete